MNRTKVETAHGDRAVLAFQLQELLKAIEEAADLDEVKDAAKIAAAALEALK